MNAFTPSTAMQRRLLTRTPAPMARASFLTSPIQQGNPLTEYLMSLSMPETGRITLTLTTRTIKALRLLALLKDESQNDVAEALLIAGGLHNLVDSEWSAGKPDQPMPTARAPLQVPAAPQPMPTPQAPAPIPQAAPTPKPASLRDGWMPEVPKDADKDDPSPYKF